MLGKGLLLALGGALAMLPSAAAAAACPGPPGCERWTRLIESDRSVYAEASALAPDGRRLAVTGRVDVRYDDPACPLEPRYRAAALVAGIDAAGGLLWQTFHRHAFMGGSGVDDFNDVGFSPNGETVYAAGTWGKSGDRPDPDLLVAAYDSATGKERWAHAFDGPGRQRDVGGVLAVSPDGRSLVTAGTVCVVVTDRCEDWDWLVARIDADTGALRWSVRHGSGEPNDEPRGAAISSDGSTVIVIGTTGTGCAGIAAGPAQTACDTDTATVGFDMTDGSQRWLVRDDPPSTDDQPVAIAVHPDTTAVVTVSNSRTAGTSEAPGTSVAATTALDPSRGRVLWRMEAPRASGADVAFLAGGDRVVVVGTEDEDVASYVHDVSTGRLRAAVRHDGPMAGDDAGEAVAPAPSGGWAVVASVRAGPALTDYDGAVVAYRARAVRAWSTVLPAIRRPGDIHVAPDGRAVIATGTSEDSDGPDAVAVGLDPGDALEPCRPTARITRAALRRKRVRLSGIASSGCDAALSRVHVSVAARHGRRCRHMGSRGALGRARSCDHRTWIAASGTRRWSLRLTARLRRGSYVVAARAAAAGVMGRQATRRLRFR